MLLWTSSALGHNGLIQTNHVHIHSKDMSCLNTLGHLLCIHFRGVSALECRELQGICLTLLQRSNIILFYQKRIP